MPKRGDTEQPSGRDMAPDIYQLNLTLLQALFGFRRIFNTEVEYYDIQGHVHRSNAARIKNTKAYFGRGLEESDWKFTIRSTLQELGFIGNIVLEDTERDVLQKGKFDALEGKMIFSFKGSPHIVYVHSDLMSSHTLTQKLMAAVDREIYLGISGKNSPGGRLGR